MIIINVLFTAIGIQFEQATYPYLESAGTSMVCALLEGEADREIVVTFESASGSAEGLLATVCNLLLVKPFRQPTPSNKFHIIYLSISWRGL